jgi:hypothetical protein
MAIAAWSSVPAAVTIDSASLHEFKLVDKALAGSFFDSLSEKLIGGKTYDSDPVDRHLDEEYGIEMIAPKRESRSKTRTAKPCAAGLWSGCSHACTGSVGWLRATNFMRKTFLAWSGSAA